MQMNRPYLLYSDDKGNIFEDTSLLLAGRRGTHTEVPGSVDLTALPEGSDFFHLPGRRPVGFDPTTQTFRVCNKGWAVAAFVAPAYTITHHAAWETQPRAPRLPLYAYAALGWTPKGFYTTAFRIDPDIRQDCNQFDQNLVKKNASAMLRKNSSNRLLQHLSHCAIVYFCPAARNYFLKRWEAPLPSSPACNSRCVGCISYQPKQSRVSSTQNRITFVPTPEEIAEIAVPHLETAPNPVVSFGQGCEGEPLMVWETLVEAVRLIRSKTSRGIINLNTNASNPSAIAELCRAGLQSIRVSMNSVQEGHYMNYYKPANYNFGHVLSSIEAAAGSGIWISVNYFVFPGYTDHPEETKALREFLKSYPVNMIQWRNFNIDPDWYHQIIKPPQNQFPEGIRQHIRNIRQEFPAICHGYYNPGIDIIRRKGNPVNLP